MGPVFSTIDALMDEEASDGPKSGFHFWVRCLTTRFDCRRRPTAAKSFMAPNDEFIREVDEEYRRDQIAQIWQRYNGIIVGVIVLVVACVGGWRFWQHMQETRAQEAAARYEEALRLSSEDKGQEAQAAFETVLKEDGGTGYALLARFRLAAELGQQNAENGASAYDALASDASVPALWKDLARLRAAWLRLDTAEACRPAAGRRAARRTHQCLAPFRSGTLRLVRP